MVTGAAAVLIQKYPNLVDWPEGIRAVLHATAWHDIEKSTKEKDGAGGIDLDKAYKTVSFANGGWVGKPYSCANASPFEMTSAYMHAGRRTRVALSWQNNSGDYGLWQAQPGADVDLDVIGPDGQMAASSFKFDKTNEVVDFTAPKTGYSKIRALKVRCTGAAGTSPGSVAAAWYNAP